MGVDLEDGGVVLIVGTGVRTNSRHYARTLRTSEHESLSTGVYASPLSVAAQLQPSRIQKFGRSELSLIDSPAEIRDQLSTNHHHHERYQTRPAYAWNSLKMPAPTALVRKPEELADNLALEPVEVPLPTEDEDAELLDMNIEPSNFSSDAPDVPADDIPMTDESGRPKFAPSKSIPLAFRREQRKVPIPPHRMTPLKSAWPKIYVRPLQRHPMWPMGQITNRICSLPSSNTSSSKSA